MDTNPAVERALAAELHPAPRFAIRNLDGGIFIKKHLRDILKIEHVRAEYDRF